MMKTKILQQQLRRILANYSIKSCLFSRSYKTLSAVKIHLEQWLKQGDQVKSYVRGLIKDFRDTKQFSKAFEASEWMCKKRVLEIFPNHYAARLHLVETVLGLEEAEKFFQSIPKNMRDYSVYDILLRSYCKSEKTLDKAEATFEKMRDLGFLSKPSPFNSMISLYRQLEKRDIVKKLQREMMENNMEIDSPIENDVWGFAREVLNPVWNYYKKRGKLMDDKYRTRISYLLKLDDVQGAKKIYEEWQPIGPKLDMSIPGLLISRFRAEGNESKVKELISSIRMKRIVMHARTLIVYLLLGGTTIRLLAVRVAIMVAIMGVTVRCIVWIFKKYLLLDPTFLGMACCLYLIPSHPILFIFFGFLLYNQ